MRVRVPAAVLLAERAEAGAAPLARASEREAAAEVDERLAASRACEREDLLDDVVPDLLPRVVGARLGALDLQPLLEARLELRVDTLLGDALLGGGVRGEGLLGQRLVGVRVRARARARVRFRVRVMQ